MFRNPGVVCRWYWKKKLRREGLFLLLLVITIMFLNMPATAQEKDMTFAIVTDIHIGYAKAEQSLINTIEDINRNTGISFVLVSGDLTANGSYDQLNRAKELLGKLNKKVYYIPGNHEEVWSPSGGTAFKEVFGNDRFAFQYAGYLFIGTDCGPLLRHGLAHVPKDNIKWLDSTLRNLKDKGQPVIFVNHYPMNDNVDNYHEVLNLLKEYNIQLILCGHGHRNRKYNFSGVPGIMSRTNLPDAKDQGGYNIVSVRNGVISFRERNPSTSELKASWVMVSLRAIPKDSIRVPQPDYAINTTYPIVQEKWQYVHNDDITGGFAADGEFIYSGTADGKLIALKKSTGTKVWSYIAGGKIFSTPALSKDAVVFASTNGKVYCLSTKGKLLWTFASQRAVVCSPVISGNRVFVGFSDGTFRCLDKKSGALLWQYDGIAPGFVQSPMLYKEKVYFGAWNSYIYCLDQNTGKEVWKWNNQKAVAYSPATVPPLAVNNRIFTVTPDHYITTFDAATGALIWRQQKEEVPVWFSRGLSQDSTTLFVKTRNNNGMGVSTAANEMKITWEAPLDLDDDTSPTPVYDDGGIVYFSSNSGTVIAVSKQTSKTVWEHRVSNSPINMLLLAPSGDIYVSSVDGKIVCLQVAKVATAAKNESRLNKKDN